MTAARPELINVFTFIYYLNKPANIPLFKSIYTQFDSIHIKQHACAFVQIEYGFICVPIAARLSWKHKIGSKQQKQPRMKISKNKNQMIFQKKSYVFI
jgi:hypothetical protein